MTYLVLARKWRPRSFDTLIGQDHVVRALTHALSTQRLHHAWLFTGTRGVGKTTLSRILAKSLNCETGITAAPCGVCNACTEIDEGRFVDYLELDAASNRGVDEMTQLLEQAVYAPSVGRFKVYMIDEVHMLTGHAFNAMLKTLEEPPPHVKFILATTDPQKIPVTVLSRCLQFNLKQMTAQAMIGHLQHVLDQEKIPYEVPALRLIAQAASGSMRDALSLTDQAIAYSAENLGEEAVRGMLGTIDQRYLARLLHALAGANSTDVLAVADELAARGLSYSGALADLAVLLSRIAIEQRLPGTVPGDDPLADEIAALAGLLHPDLVQLFYSVAVHSRTELSLAPDEYAGFVMACLRMLALAPPSADGGDNDGAQKETPEVRPTLEARSTAPDADAEPASRPEPESGAKTVAPGTTHVAPAPLVEPVPIPAQLPSQAGTSNTDRSEPPPAWEDLPDENMKGGLSDGNRNEPPDFHFEDAGYGAAPGAMSGDPDLGTFQADDDFETLSPGNGLLQGGASSQSDALAHGINGIDAPTATHKRTKKTSPRLPALTAATWPKLAATLPLTGLAAQLARQSELLDVQGQQINLRVAVRSLVDSPGKARLRTVLSEHFGTAVLLNVEYGVTGDATAHAVEQARQLVLQQEAEQAVHGDPFIQTLVDEFDARVVADSIRPLPDGKAA